MEWNVTINDLSNDLIDNMKFQHTNIDNKINEIKSEYGNSYNNKFYIKIAKWNILGYDNDEDFINKNENIINNILPNIVNFGNIIGYISYIEEIITSIVFYYEHGSVQLLISDIYNFPQKGSYGFIKNKYIMDIATGSTYY